VQGCEARSAPPSCSAASAWSLHPVQIDIAKKVFFSPDPEEGGVAFAKKVIEAIPDGAAFT